MIEPTDLRACYEVTMLALLIWREARGQSIEGQIQVGYTVKNRIDHPKWWGKDWIEVIFKKWQYSSLTDPRDRQLTRWPGSNEESWLQAISIAYNIYYGTVHPKYKSADSYYDDSIRPPRWATRDKMLGKIGRIVFYNIDGDTDD